MWDKEIEEIRIKRIRESDGETKINKQYTNLEREKRR